MKKHSSDAFDFSLPKLTVTQYNQKFDDLKQHTLRFCAGVILAFKNPSITDLMLVNRLYTSTGVTRKSLNKLIYDASEGRIVLFDSCNTCTDMENCLRNLLDTDPTSITRSWYRLQLERKTTIQQWKNIFQHQHFQYKYPKKKHDAGSKDSGKNTNNQLSQKKKQTDNNGNNGRRHNDNSKTNHPVSNNNSSQVTSFHEERN